eukprot:Gregarina_sp_Poly_1__2295@NODE_1611_length_3717_cov_65_703836_g1062_i0_p1_GENE_NODE_1611_length_3717_cov_65_703836_g1062_i0NODE_1611_length_3717_cov_65_703836_g1062_i0_p1_ORF_typecomplete_len798_score71_70Na_H_Exchanger/PF00999_21/3_3e28TIG/PF01833_24/0_00014TIG/PF01833_24/15_NODE_1611_length_3717_cov_65_703836_g1062_i013193712
MKLFWILLRFLICVLGDDIQLASISPSSGPATGGTKVSVKGFGFKPLVAPSESLRVHFDVIDEHYHILNANVKSNSLVEYITPVIDIESIRKRRDEKKKDSSDHPTQLQTMLALVSLHFQKSPVLHDKNPEPFKIYEAPELMTLWPEQIAANPGGHECFLFASHLFASSTIQVQLKGDYGTEIVEGHFDVVVSHKDSLNESHIPVITFTSPRWPRSDNVSVELSMNGQQFHERNPPLILQLLESESLLDKVAEQVKDRQGYYRVHSRYEAVSASAGSNDETSYPVRAKFEDSFWTSTWFFKWLLRPHHSKAVSENLIRLLLVDSQANKFVLSDPARIEDMKPDYRFMFDIFLAVLIPSFGGCLSVYLNFPPELGFLLAGMLLATLHEISIVLQPIQLTTIGHFGSTVLLFDLGRSLSLTRLQKLRRIFLWGGLFSILCLTLIFGVIATCTNRSVPEAILVGWFFVHSSTSIAQAEIERRPQLKSSMVGDSILGLLAFQDMSLGFMLSLVPYLNMGGWISSPFGAKQILSAILSLILRLGGGTLIFALLGTIVSLLLPFSLIFVSANQHNSRALLLCIFTSLISMSLIANCSGLSYELGAFCAGLLFTQLPKDFYSSVSQAISPVATLFSILYFGTIGLSTNIVLIWDNLLVLLGMSLGFTLVKFVILLPLVKLGSQLSFPVAVLVTASVSQFGELDLILLAKAHSYGVTSLKVYNLLVGLTTISLVSCPFVLRLVHFVGKDYYESICDSEAEERTSSKFIFPLLHLFDISRPPKNNSHQETGVRTETEMSTRSRETV